MECSEISPLSSSSSYSLYNNNNNDSNNNNNQVSNQTQIVQGISNSLIGSNPIDSGTNRITLIGSKGKVKILEKSDGNFSFADIKIILNKGFTKLKISSGDAWLNFYIKDKVLKAVSPRFKDLMECDFIRGSDQKEIEMFVGDPKLLILTSSFITKGDCSITSDNAVGLLQVADYYMIEELKKKCEECLMESITIENYRELWDETKHIDLPNLHNELLHFAISSFLLTDVGPTHNELKEFLMQQGHCLRRLNSATISGQVSKFLPLLPFFPNITTLSLFHAGGEFPAEIVQKCPKLLTLTVVASSYYFEESDFLRIIKDCPQTLENLDISDLGVGDLSLTFIVRRLPNLQSLNANYCSITREGLKTIAEGCQKLKSLKVESEAINSKQGIPLQDILPKCPNLEELDMNIDRNVLIDDFRLIQGPLPLRKLRINGKLNMTGIEEILMKCPNLEELDIRSYDNGTYFHNQQGSVSVDFSTKPHFQLSNQTYPNLRRFWIKVCDISEEDKNSLIKEIQQRCPSLKDLQITLKEGYSDGPSFANFRPFKRYKNEVIELSA